MTGFSVETKIDPLDLPTWLQAQDLFPKMYIKCPKTGVETALLGSLQEFDHIPSLKEKAYGVIAFPSFSKDALWKDFSSPFFFLPQVEIVQSKEETHLKIRGPTPRFNLPAQKKASLFLEKVEDVPHFDCWETSVQEILRDIQEGNLQKAVLARRTTFKTQGSSFSSLQGLLDTAFNSVVFAFQKTPASLFLGATPEMLYTRKGRLIHTESIAGTRKRGTSSLEDVEIEQLLLKSHKDMKEISFVRTFLEEKLSSLCSTFTPSPNYSSIKTSHLIHLYHSLQGNLHSDVSDLDIISHLHPTPATCSFPKKEGLEKIQSLEPFDRGLYAGVIGWTSEEDSSFSVAIRSALIQEGFLHAFAGVGIVEGSDPKLEWQELDHKISHWSALCPIPL